MFKVNNNDIRTTSMALFWCLYYQLGKSHTYKLMFDKLTSNLTLHEINNIYRSSHQRCFVKKGVTGKHLYQSLFFNKVAGLRPLTLLKKRLWYRCFSVNFAKFLRTPILKNTSGGCFYIYITFASKYHNRWMKKWSSTNFCKRPDRYLVTCPSFKTL